MNKLESIANDLREEHSRLTDERNAVQARLHQMDAELKRVEVALSALGDKSKPARTKSGKPAPKQEDVEEAVKQILAEQGALELGPLKKQVEAKLTQLGRTKMGIALRLKEVLANKQTFIESPAGWKLIESEVESSVT